MVNTRFAKTSPADLFQKLVTMTVAQMLNVSQIVHPLPLLLALFLQFQIQRTIQSVMKITDNVSSLMVMVSPNVTVYLVVAVEHMENVMKTLNVFKNQDQGRTSVTRIFHVISIRFALKMTPASWFQVMVLMRVILMQDVSNLGPPLHLPHYLAERLLSI